MIQKISPSIFSQSFRQKNNLPQNQEKIPNRKSVYADSFVRHAKESAPLLLGLTAVWSVLDYGTKSLPMKKVLLNNVLGFFAPVLVLSSALLAGIENKNMSKSS